MSQELADDMNALKAYHKEKREARAVVNIASLAALGIPAREQSKNVFRIEHDREVCMYYPSSGKWQCKGQVFWGTPEKLKGWLMNRGFLQ